MREAAVGEEVEAGLVDGDSEHAGIVPEDALDAVAVVGVEVEVGDAGGALVEEPLDGDGGVVVHAKAGHGIRERVVKSAGEVERARGAALPHGLGSLE